MTTRNKPNKETVPVYTPPNLNEIGTFVRNNPRCYYCNKKKNDLLAILIRARLKMVCPECNALYHDGYQ